MKDTLDEGDQSLIKVAALFWRIFPLAINILDPIGNSFMKKTLLIN